MIQTEVAKDFNNLSSTNSQESLANSTSSCWSCKKEVAKYKCPRCLTKTCSLACVKYHKTIMNCTGVRDKTKYIPKEEFNEAHLLSDYRFLEEMNRCACKLNRYRLFKAQRQRNWAKLHISKAASMNIGLRKLPKSFKRREENSTYYSFNNNGFLWHVEWIFTSCDVTVSDIKFQDGIPLIEGISKHIKPDAGNSLYDPRLHLYSDKSDLRFYMKKEGTPANKIEFFKLDGNKGFRSNLEGKTIIEYPRVYVVLSEESEKYEDSLVSR